MEQLVKNKIAFILIFLFFIGCRDAKKEYYGNGNLRSVILLDKNNNFHGQAKFYYENEDLEKIVDYNHGKIIYCKVFFQNGQLMWESPYSENRKNGNSTEYFSNGKISYKILYCDGIIISGKGWDSLGILNYEYIRLDTNSIPKFDSSYIKLINGKISSENFTKIKLEVPSIPCDQYYPEIINGEARVLDRMKGIWEVKSIKTNKPTYIGIVILLEKDKTYTIGYNTY